ncbi:MAG: porin [Candidatus Paracaedibacteraceae bacterium]|nr:porin [Candidatus Paracaedibacteraceae bacterium]
MKKLVLSAVAVAALSTSAMADAVAPTLQISGNTIMNAYAVSQKVKNNGKARAHHFSNDISDLYFLVAGRTASGIEYKYKLNFQAFSNANPLVTQNYVEFNTNLGTFQFGNVVGPEDTVIQDAGAIVGGAGAFDGGFKNVFNISAFSLRGNDIIGDTGYATKFVYYTKELWNAIRFAIGFTPQTSHLGDAKLDNNSIQSNSNVPGVRNFLPHLPSNMDIYGVNSWTFGASFKKDVGNWGINLNAAYVTDRSYLSATNQQTATYNTALAGNSKLKLRNTSAYQLGAIIGYRRANGHLIQVGGGWLDNGHSRNFRNQATISSGGKTVTTANLHKGDSGQAWNAGAGYTFGAYKVAASYQHMERKTDAVRKAKTNVWSLTGDVVPVAGLKFFGEVDYVSTKSNEAARGLAQNFSNAFNAKANADTLANSKNNGTVFIMGTKISF